MKGNDNEFIKNVVEYYYSTIGTEHPQGNMSAVAEHFGVTRPKVNKILITAGVIDSPLHQDIVRLKREGYDTDDIALALGVSPSTVKINMPYEKVIYNGEEKSVGAQYVEAFREREKVFLSNVVRAKTPFEHEFFYSAPGKEDFGQTVTEDLKDDPIHLDPLYAEEEWRLFKVPPRVVVLHIELNADLSEVRKEAHIEYGKTVSRDILVPTVLPLHNLHYAINQAFGFTNSHLHEYKFSEEDVDWLTQGKVSRWKKQLGLAFKNPYRDEELDFWDDDYEGGSPKKWMRSKYTGPGYIRVYEESYWYIQDSIKDEKLSEKSIDELHFEHGTLCVNEALSIGEAISEDGHQRFKSLEEYDDLMQKSIDNVASFPKDSPQSRPQMAPFAKELYYTYDFGDDWNFIIASHDDVEYLGGRVTASGMKEAIKSVLTLARPVVIAADGLPLIEDVGGPYGLRDFYKGRNQYEDYAESVVWAKGNGWSSKIGNLKTLL